MAMTLSDRWNLVSVPVRVSDYRRSAIYPSADGPAFAYAGGYLSRDTLSNGEGYWILNDGGFASVLGGIVRTSDTVDVTPGWNLIGALSDPLPVRHISSLPGGIATSPFFGYDGSYFTADTLLPGSGYWVKADQAGALILSAAPPAIPGASIHIRPTEERPPLPPGAEVTTGETLPADYALGQNYPNPFNPVTTISFSMAAAGYATVHVFNILGECVATLVSGEIHAGIHRVQWDASGFTSGMYSYRLSAGDFTAVGRMVLMR
jgi:hypothetical protein